MALSVRIVELSLRTPKPSRNCVHFGFHSKGTHRYVSACSSGGSLFAHPCHKTVTRQRTHARYIKSRAVPSVEASITAQSMIRRRVPEKSPLGYLGVLPNSEAL